MIPTGRLQERWLAKPGTRTTGVVQPGRLMTRCAIIGATVVLASGCAHSSCPVVPSATGHGVPDGVQPTSSDSQLRAFISRLGEATDGMLNGDPTLWKELASHSDEATLFGPFGGVTVGWADVAARYEAAAARRPPGDAGVDIELISSGVSGDLAYVVSLERSRFRVEGSDELRSGFTRVTHILRREQGQWKLLHRHMDHLPETATPPAR